MMRVLRAGLQSVIQDLGRYGYQPLGFSSCGVADTTAHRWANLLAGNPPEAATMEMMLQGATLQFNRGVWVAVTGAKYVRVGDERLPGWCGFWVKPGETVHLGDFQGVYAYLAVAGGIAVDPVMGSRSTDLVAGVGGFMGRPLQANDAIPIGTSLSTAGWNHSRLRRPTNVPELGNGDIRILPGPRQHLMDSRDWKEFLDATYTVGVDSNRMGLRLKSSNRPPSLPAVLSEGMAPGSIEMTPDGSPLVLLPSRGTLGGYPVIATVVSADLSRAAQCKPGTSVHFRLISVDEAMSLWRDQMQKIAEGAVEWHDRFPSGPERPHSGEHRILRAPLPGVIYFRPNPEARAFKRENDTLNTGDVLALIEVMKTFQEVTSPVEARIFSRYLVEDGSVVEEGQPIIEWVDADTKEGMR